MDLILKYFPHLTPKQQEAFAQLPELYQYWNQQINVVSRKDLDNLYERHVLHALAIARFRKFIPGTSVLDIGTGGGFPGIPLAILFPQVYFHLVDSIAKKIKVVEAVVSVLQLDNVMPIVNRAEQLPKLRYEYAVTRAVADLKTLYHWSRPLLIPSVKGQERNGLIALKGGDLAEEFKGFKYVYQVHEVSKYFSEPFYETKKIVFVPC
jgi:16S rRNA (guanine527-N7)-methyltransferase